MEIIKVVLTGGPCAGKTTALNSIKEYLTKNNIPVFTVPETATELILNGIIPLNEETIYKFQSLVLDKQISKEKITEEYIKSIKRPIGKCIIIYDRGLIDNKAYLSNKKDFDRLLIQNNLTEIDVLDSYDLVLDLLSTASCKIEAYNLFNKARLEDANTAIEVDRKTSLAWIHHRNLKMINSSISLEEETDIIINYVREILEHVQTKKIRKFLVNNYLSNYKFYNNENSEKLYITDYFLEVEDTCNHVISKREYNNEISYVYSVYSEENGEVKVYHDKKINLEEYIDLLSKYKVTTKIAKKEINFIYNKQKYKLCFYDDYTVLEVEESRVNNNLLFPDNLKITKEITKDNKLVKVRRLDNGNI